MVDVFMIEDFDQALRRRDAWESVVSLGLACIDTANGGGYGSPLYPTLAAAWDELRTLGPGPGCPLPHQSPIWWQDDVAEGFSRLFASEPA